jgi:hypothetical protein
MMFEVFVATEGFVGSVLPLVMVRSSMPNSPWYLLMNITYSAFHWPMYHVTKILTCPTYKNPVVRDLYAVGREMDEGSQSILVTGYLFYYENVHKCRAQKLKTP